jgi:acyl-CoA synthetase (AMP-forming)/AMP-acid ligase II
MIEPSRLLAMLSAHAHEHGDLLCHWLPERLITYRRFWSRIERASARLQGEWGIKQGQTIAYVGASHPDIIVLYAALVRIGAAFMPLEDLSMQAAMPFVQQADISHVVVDDHTTLVDRTTHYLPQLLADWCHFEPEVNEENPLLKSLLLPSASGLIDHLSLSVLCVKLSPRASSHWVTGSIFDVESLTTIVWPSLRDLQTLHFSAIEKTASVNLSNQQE